MVKLTFGVLDSVGQVRRFFIYFVRLTVTSQVSYDETYCCGTRLKGKGKMNSELEHVLDVLSFMPEASLLLLHKGIKMVEDLIAKSKKDI